MKNIIALVSTFLLFIMVSCSQKETLNLYNWSYYIPDEVLVAFEKESGIRVSLTTYDSNETMYAKLASGNSGFDLAVPSGDYASIMIEQGMLASLDKTLLPNLENIDRRVMDLARYDPDHNYTVPYFVGAAGVNVNTKAVPNFTESWDIFARNDVAVYRKMSMLNDMREVLGAALLKLGYSVNSHNPSELQKAKQLVLQWKKNLLKFDAESFGKDFASGNVVVAQGYAEAVIKELEGPSSESYKFFIPKEGVPIYLDNLVILKDSQKQAQAHQFMNFLLQPEIHAQIADTYYYPTIMAKAEELRQTTPPYTIDELFAKGGQLREDVGDALSLYTQIWDEILAH